MFSPSKYWHLNMQFYLLMIKTLVEEGEMFLEHENTWKLTTAVL